MAPNSYAAGPELTHTPRIEYRAGHNWMSPLSLNDQTAESVSYIDQRLQINEEIRYGKGARIVLRLDVLDGVLGGDNGSFIGTPRRNRGARVGAKNPNYSTLGFGRLDPNGDALDFDNYGFVLQEQRPIEVSQAWGEAQIPVGILRAGRLPVATRGRTILIHPNDRRNKWGVSRGNDAIDGFVFGTKISAIADAIAGRTPDASQDNGLFYGTLVGHIVEQDVTRDDDILQNANSIWYTRKDASIGPFWMEKLEAALVQSRRWSNQFDTALNTLTGSLEFETKHWRFAYHHLFMWGQTREVSEALALLSSTAGDPALQDIDAFGGFGELTYKNSLFELTFETFYASGDPDARTETPINQLTFAPDTNVGLHLFENVISYYTGRSAALAIENVRTLDPETYPIAEIWTRGSMRNAIVFFPQAFFHPHPKLDLRFGAMFAFTQVSDVDPIGTLLNRDGIEIEDDNRNYAGGDPGDYFGTELDFGITWKPSPGFFLDFELAYLLPGDALEDEHGDAVNSLFTNLRFTYAFGEEG